MKTIVSLAVAASAVLCVTVGGAEALPAAALTSANDALRAPIVDAAVVVTKSVRRGPFGGRVVTKRVVRRGFR